MLTIAPVAAAPEQPAASAVLRVLHVHSGNMLGGVESMLLAQAAAARRSQVRLEFALCFAGAFSRRVEETGAPCTLLGEARLRDPIRTRRSRRALAALLFEHPPDAAIVHSGWTQALFAPVLRRAGVPWIRWQHAPLRRSQLLERVALRCRPALVICNSAFTRSASVWAYDGVPCHVLYCPVALTPAATARADVRRRFGTGVDDVVITIVGRFEPLKGHDVLLRALARLASDARWTCWIVGAPQSRAELTWLDELRKLAHDLGIATRLRFTGLRADVGALLTASDIYCQPNSGPEGFGLALVEALAAGVPVVTTEMGAASEIVEPGSGVLVQPRDVAGLADVLARLIESPEERAALGARGAARAASFPDAHQHVQALAAVLGRVMGVRS